MSSEKKWPTKSQWIQFPGILTKKEKVFVIVFLFGAIYSLSFLMINFYFQNTEIRPAVGGEYSEGLVGQPRFLNPIYAQTNDVDRDLVEFLFSGLMKYTPDGKIVPELVENYQILEEGRIYDFYLKENIFWQDGTPITIDDIIFTIETIQNPGFNSPLRVNWLGVEVERISERALRFTLEKPSAIFLENATLKIIPKHIWESVSAENFPLTFYNLRPVGSGPYKLEELSQDKRGRISSLRLISNPKYFEKKPNIPKITFYFFDDETDLLKSYLRGEIKGFALNSIINMPKNDLGLKVHSLSLPRYFALFFNLEESEILSDETIRKALNYATDNKEIIEGVFSDYGKVVYSPILPQIYGLKEPTESYSFNLEKATELLEEAGFFENEEGYRVKTIEKKSSFQFQSNLQVGSQSEEVEELQKCLASLPGIYPEGQITGYFGQATKEAIITFQEQYKDEILTPYGLNEGTGQVRKSTRAKLNELCCTEIKFIPLEFKLVTVEQPLLTKTANLVKSQWARLGIKLEVEAFDVSKLEREIIKKRDYQILLFGEVLGLFPDPFPFWHSSQKSDPGLNLSLFSDTKCDKLLEEARYNLNKEIRKEKLEEFQNILLKKAPCVFLYSPDYIYLVNAEIKGIEETIIVDPSKRFNDVENWYIRTKRAWK
jgi:ABC-type transport system substrate-binding protein